MLIDTMLPFIHRYAAVMDKTFGLETATGEDLLPAIVEIGSDGMVKERATKLTKVTMESTDD